MDPEETPEEEVAAIDAVFEEWPAVGYKPPPPAAEQPPLAAQPLPEAEAPAKNPLKDYLRELQEEFEEQEDEGKL